MIFAIKFYGNMHFHARRVIFLQDLVNFSEISPFCTFYSIFTFLLHFHFFTPFSLFCSIFTFLHFLHFFIKIILFTPVAPLVSKVYIPCSILSILKPFSAPGLILGHFY